MRECEHEQSPIGECDFVRYRKRLQMEALPESYGNWHAAYVRMNRWSKNGVLQRLFEGLQRENIIKINLDAVCLDSASMKVHPHGSGALKKTGNKKLIVPEEGLQQKFIWTPRLTMRPFHSQLLSGNAGDGSEGRRLLSLVPHDRAHRYLIMDRVCEGD